MVKHGLKSRKTQAKTEQFSIAKKRQANTTIKSDPTGRMESFTDVDVNIAGGACTGTVFAETDFGFQLVSGCEEGRSWGVLTGRPGAPACLWS